MLISNVHIVQPLKMLTDSMGLQNPPKNLCFDRLICARFMFGWLLFAVLKMSDSDLEGFSNAIFVDFLTFYQTDIFLWRMGIGMNVGNNWALTECIYKTVMLNVLKLGGNVVNDYHLVQWHCIIDFGSEHWIQALVFLVSRVWVRVLAGRGTCVLEQDTFTITALSFWWD